jgi:hypothetical protein
MVLGSWFLGRCDFWERYLWSGLCLLKMGWVTVDQSTLLSALLNVYPVGSSSRSCDAATHCRAVCTQAIWSGWNASKPTRSKIRLTR